MITLVFAISISLYLLDHLLEIVDSSTQAPVLAALLLLSTLSVSDHSPYPAHETMNKKKKPYLILIRISPLPCPILPRLDHGTLELLIAKFVLVVAELATTSIGARRALVATATIVKIAASAAVVVVVVDGFGRVRAAVVVGVEEDWRVADVVSAVVSAVVASAAMPVAVAVAAGRHVGG